MPICDLRALFLGPEGGNKDLLLQMITDIINDQAYWRRNFHPDDPPVITEATKEEQHFRDTTARLRDELNRMLAELRDSIPFFSPRYIAHMNADVLVPAIVGYFAGMLYNSNNVTSESSPVTSRYEVEVANDLARLVGFTPSESFGHLTSGGTTANYEALWIARNLRYLPLLAKDMADRANVPLAGGSSERSVQGGDNWSLMNLPAKEAMDMYRGVLAALGAQGLDGEDLQELAAESRYALSENGMWGMPAGVVFVPSTAHYSWSKAVELLGIGRRNLRKIPIDRHFRMDLTALDEAFHRAQTDQTPVIATVGIFGGTEEGAVDPIDGILRIRDKYRKKGVDSFVHVDAAYGGYARSLFVDEYGHERTHSRLLPEIDWPSPTVFGAQRALADVESVTIDPHKLGYVPYACGAIVFRNNVWRELIKVEAPYIIHGGKKDAKSSVFLGQHILEGSKAGAAAAAVCLSHRILPPHSGGYGRLIGASIRGMQQLYLRFVAKEKHRIDRDVEITIHPLTRPDLNIMCFVVNRVGNQSLEKMNALNSAIYDHFTYTPGRVIGTHNFLISTTAFSRNTYGEAAEHVLDVAGVDTDLYRSGSAEIAVLRLTVMHPWYELNMQSDLVDEFASELIACVGRIYNSKRELFY